MFHKFFKSRWKIILIGFVLSLLLTVPILSAQDAVLSADEKCASKMRDYLSVEGPIFLSEIDAHFQNSSSTTSLIPLATEKFTAYKNMASAQLALLQADIGGGDTQYNTVIAFARCQKELDDNSYMMEKIIRDHVKRVSSAKRTYIMTTEYRNINDKMAALNREIGQMKGYFQVLDSKLSGFIPKCVKG